MECFPTSYRHNHLIVQINLTSRQKCDFTFPLGFSDSAVSAGPQLHIPAPFLSCQMAAGPDLTSELLHRTGTGRQDSIQAWTPRLCSIILKTHFHPWLELELYKTNSKHFTDAQVACLPLTPGFSYGSTSPMPLPWTRGGLIRIYTGKAEHIIWALYRRLTVRR